VGWTAFRILFGAVAAVLLIYALLGLLLTGPVAVRVPTFSLDPDVSSRRLRETVQRLCTDFSPRSYRHTENLDRAADWIAEQFRLAGLEVEFQAYDVEGRTFRNVIARRSGSDPEAGIDVIGAHYDAYDEFPGANDNASGVAVLLELARTLPDDPHRRTHLFVAFCTEEPPYFATDQMGSHVFARRLVDRGERVELMIALDLVGYFSDEPRSQSFPFAGLGLFYPSKGDFIAVVGDSEAGPWIKRVKRGMIAMRAIPVHSFRAPPALAPVHLSDHLAFRRLGLPGVQVTDTAFMRYPHYHTPDDVPERLDYERMAGVVRALHGVIWEGPGEPG
jgi:Zn-dependent M28 family amino/carboxypeptidase